MKCTIAPHFWAPDHTLPNLKATKFRDVADRYKLWAPHTADTFASAELKGCFNQISGGTWLDCLTWINSLNLPIESELVLNNPGQIPNTNESAVSYGQWVGNFTFDIYYKGWLEKGGRLDTIVLDGPFNKLCAGGLYKHGFSDPMLAAICTVFAILKIKENFENYGKKLSFQYLENLNWAGFYGQPAEYGSLGDLTAATTRLFQMAKDCGVPLLEVQIDMPYTSLKKDKLSLFKATCENMYRVPVSLIVNSGTTAIDTKNPPPYDPTKSDKNVKDIKALLAVAKSYKFERCIAQTWQPEPTFISFPGLPEGHTLLSQASLIRAAV